MEFYTMPYTSKDVDKIAKKARHTRDVCEFDEDNETKSLTLVQLMNYIMDRIDASAKAGLSYTVVPLSIGSNEERATKYEYVLNNALLSLTEAGFTATFSKPVYPILTISWDSEIPISEF